MPERNSIKDLKSRRPAIIRTLSRTLTAIGGDRHAQQQVFQYLSSQSSQLIYDLLSLFSSGTVNLAEFGYNAEGVWLP